MNEVDAFKDFVKTRPELAAEVHEKRYTWQELYEMYALYGQDHEIWQNFQSPNSVNSNAGTGNPALDLGTLLSLLKTVDINALLSSMQGLQKILGIAAALFEKDEPVQPGLESLSRMDD